MDTRVPNALIDALRSEFNLKSDAALADLIGWDRPVISKIRRKYSPVSPDRILQIHDATGWSIEKIRSLV